MTIEERLAALEHDVEALADAVSEVQANTDDGACVRPMWWWVQNVSSIATAIRSRRTRAKHEKEKRC